MAEEEGRGKPRNLESAIYRRADELAEKYPGYDKSVDMGKGGGEGGRQQERRPTPRSTPPEQMDTSAMPVNEGSWLDRNNPLRRVDMLIEDRAMASLYKEIMLLGFATFIVTIIGFIATCNWFNFLGFFHVAALLYPYFGCIVNPGLYAGFTGFALLMGIISLLAGLFSSFCALSAFLLGAVYNIFNVAILYLLVKFDPEVRRHWQSFAGSCACGGKSTSPDPGASDKSVAANQV